MVDYSNCRTEREKLYKWMSTCPFEDVIELNNTDDYVDYSFGVKKGVKNNSVPYIGKKRGKK